MHVFENVYITQKKNQGIYKQKLFQTRTSHGIEIFEDNKIHLYHQGFR